MVQQGQQPRPRCLGLLPRALEDLAQRPSLAVVGRGDAEKGGDRGGQVHQPRAVRNGAGADPRTGHHEGNVLFGEAAVGPAPLTRRWLGQREAERDGGLRDDVALVAARVQRRQPGDVALCGDGTLTSSAGRQGACSWHDGLDDADTGGVGPGYTYVKPYFRSDGTFVSGYYRSLPRP